MALKSGYKQTEAGVIPEDWDARTLGSIGRPVRGGSPRPAGDPRYFNGSFIPWLTVAAMTNIPSSQLTVLETETFLTESGSQLSRMLDRGTLIIANSGATLGVAKILGIKCCANDGIAALLNIKSGISPQFLAHLINAKTDYLREVVATGNGQPNLNTKLIGDFTVQLPTRGAEQDAIADALSDADVLIESLEQLLLKRRQIKQAAMQELLTKKKRLPGFIGEWDEVSLGEIGYFLKGRGVSRDQSNTGGLPCVRYGELYTFHHEHLKEYRSWISQDVAASATPIKQGDVLFAGSGETKEEIGKCIAILQDAEAYAGGDIVILRTGYRDPRFLGYYLNTSSINRQKASRGQGDAVVHISSTALSSIRCCLPPMDEQIAIADVLSEMDRAIDAVESKLVKTRQLRQGMMQELLTGRIRLIRPSAEVISFPAKGTASEATSTHNPQINEAVVIAVLSAKFGSEKFPLGRFRRTKFSYLLHRHVEHEASGFMKKAAGPYNPRTRYGGAEKIALKNRYVRVLPSGKSEGFVADENIAQAASYFEKWYGTEALTWLEQFRYYKNDALELLTTVDMACEDLSRAGKAITLSAVKQIIHDSPEWKAKLNRSVFSDDNIERTIPSCGQLFPLEKE